MNYVESVCQFDCGGEHLVGILAQPAAGAATAKTPVLIVVGGPQYRVGSHRQFVRLARSLATNGHPVLRFDYRGMGDSSGPQRDFLEVSEDIASAVTVLIDNVPGANYVALLGLCDGASAILLYLGERDDPRIEGICLLNPWARSEATLARTHLKHYYLNRLADIDFWHKLFRGNVAFGRITEFGTSLRQSLSRRGSQGQSVSGQHAPFQDVMARAWRRFERRILLVLSEDDLTAKEFVEYVSSAPAWRGLLNRALVQQVGLEGADHTLSAPESERRFEDAMRVWLLPARVVA